MDLGQVYGSIRATKMIVEICSKDFPSTAATNQRAYQEWRKQYLPFIQEMERHYSAMLYRESKNDPQEHLANLAKSEKAFDGYRSGLKKQIQSEGQDSYKKICEGYPLYLKSPRMNLEAYYAEQVATVRTGPKPQ
jgi:hypothetical protein